MRIGRILSVLGMVAAVVATAAGTAAAHAAPAQAAPPLPTTLHVVLLQATHAPAAPPATLPPAALAGLKGAIASRPFKALRLLDQALVPGLGDGGTRLKGPAGAEYILAVSAGAVPTAAAGEIGIAVHLFGTKNGVLEPTAPEVLWGEFTAKSGESVFVWPYDDKVVGGEPLVVMVTPLSRALAATFLQAPARQAADSLATILSGECGQVVDASWAPAPGGAAPVAIAPSDWKTSKARVENGLLLFERVRITPAGAGEAAVKPRSYQVTLRDLVAPEFRVSFAPRPDDPFAVFSFLCGVAGCVAVDGAPEGALRIRACTDQASELLKSLQFLVLQSGGGWQ